MPDGSGAQKPVPYLHSQFSEENGVFSPDGRRVAYVSNESGRDEVYVQAFPLTSEKHQISTDGGIDPHGAQTAPSCSIWRRIAT
jgi:Tol biopolymer transport system component